METIQLRMSEAFDLLASYGRMLAEEPDGESRGLDALERFRSAVGNPEFTASLQQGLANLRRKFDEARAFWTESLRPVLFEGDADWTRALEAMAVWDSCVYFMYALERLGPQVMHDAVKEELIDIALSIYNELDFGAYGQTSDSRYSYLRFTALNAWRRQRAERIPEDLKYMFFWYDLGVELPETLLLDLIDRWDEIARGRLDTLDLNESFPPMLLMDELRSDPLLVEEIIQQNQLQSAALALFKYSYELRLLQISRRKRMKQSPTLPQVEPAALHNYLGQVPADQTLRIERAFLAAFCAPGLSDADRVHTFEWVLGQLASSEKIDSGLASLLNGWRNGRVDQDVLAEQTLARWVTDMNSLSAEAAPVATADPTRALMALTGPPPEPIKPASSRRKGPQAPRHGIIDTIKQFWSALNALSFGRPALAFASALVLVLALAPFLSPSNRPVSMSALQFFMVETTRGPSSAEIVTPLDLGAVSVPRYSKLKISIKLEDKGNAYAVVQGADGRHLIVKENAASGPEETLDIVIYESSLRSLGEVEQKYIYLLAAEKPVSRFQERIDSLYSRHFHVDEKIMGEEFKECSVRKIFFIHKL